jgi:hypothetical protein
LIPFSVNTTLEELFGGRIEGSSKYAFQVRNRVYRKALFAATMLLCKKQQVFARHNAKNLTVIFVPEEDDNDSDHYGSDVMMLKFPVVLRIYKVQADRNIEVGIPKMFARWDNELIQPKLHIDHNGSIVDSDGTVIREIR